MTDKPNAAEFYLHTPAESSSRYVAWAEQLKDAPGVTFGCVLDRHIIPLHPGDMLAVVARPGHGKSSLMAYLTRRVANQILQRNTQEKECAIYVSWEQPVEELEAFFQSGDDYSSTDLAWGRVDLDIIKSNAIKRVNLPIWMMGTSVMDAAKKKPPMTIDVVFECIRALRDEFKLRPVLVCIDYIQRVPVFNVRDKPSKVEMATHEAKNLGMDVGCPVVVGVQASRAVDKYASPIPTLADCQWSSAIEQTADKQLSLWRPIKTHDVSDYPDIDLFGGSYKNTEELLVMRLLKQRFDVGVGTWAVHFKPQTLEMRDYIVEKLPVTEDELLNEL